MDNVARVVMDQIVRFGEVRRGRIGVQTQDLTPELARSLGLSIAEGAIVTGVEPGSPAERAGLQRGDVITAVNGQRVRNVSELMLALKNVEGGLSISLVRGDYRITILMR